MTLQKVILFIKRGGMLCLQDLGVHNDFIVPHRISIFSCVYLCISVVVEK